MIYALCIVRWMAVALLLLALILGPFFLFEPQFTALAERLMSGQAPPWYTALALGGLLGSDVILPIPSSIVSAAAGVLLGFWRGTLVVWAGMTLSCLIGYAIGARSANAARRFVGQEGLERASALAARYGEIVILVSRPVPVLAEATVIFAGLVRTPLARFLPLTSWSNLGIAMAYAAIGAFSMQMDSFWFALAGAILLPAVAALAARLWLKPGAGPGRPSS